MRVWTGCQTASRGQSFCNFCQEVGSAMTCYCAEERIELLRAPRAPQPPRAPRVARRADLESSREDGSGPMGETQASGQLSTQPGCLSTSPPLF